MTKILTMLAFLLAVAAGPARAEDDCFVPMADWRPRDAVAALAVGQGWTVRRIRIDDGCYQIKGADAEGRRIEVTLHPQTLEVIEIEYEDADDARPERDPERDPARDPERGGDRGGDGARQTGHGHD